MLNFLNKRHLPGYFYNQFVPTLMVWIFALILGNCVKLSPIKTTVSITILFFYSYIIHRVFHNLPELINVHMNYHHDKEKNKETFWWIVNLFIELTANILFFVIFYLCQSLLNIKYIPAMLIFYYGFIYVSVHIVNYSIFHTSTEHVIHHKTSNRTVAYNYGPDLLDHLFQTNYSNKFENYNNIIPNILIAFIITYYAYCRGSGTKILPFF